MNKYILLSLIIVLSAVSFQAQAEETTAVSESTIQSQTAIPVPTKKYVENCNKIEKLIKAEKYSKALELADSTIKSTPDIDTAYVLKSRILQSTEQYEDAKNIAEKALAINPKNYVAYYIIGNYYYVKTRYEEALKYYNKALEIKPDYEYALINRSNANYMLYKYDETINDASKVIKLNGSSYDAYILRGYAYGIKKEYQKALADINKAISINPKNMSAYRERAMYYADMNNPAAALADINKCEKKEPDNFYSYNCRLYVYYKINASSDLIKKDLEKARILAGNNIEEQKNLMVWEFQFKEFDNAIISANKILEQQPDNIKALSYKAICLGNLGKYDETENVLAEIEKIPDGITKADINFYETRAKIKLHKAGLYDKELIKQALEDLKLSDIKEKNKLKNQDIDFITGSAYLLLGRYEDAYYTLKKAKEQKSYIPLDNMYQMQLAEDLAEYANNNKILEWILNDEYSSTDFYKIISDSAPDEICAKINSADTIEEIHKTIEKIKAYGTKLPVGQVYTFKRNSTDRNMPVTRIEVSPFINAMGDRAKTVTPENYNLILAYEYFNLFRWYFVLAYEDIAKQDVENLYSALNNISYDNAIDIIRQLRDNDIERASSHMDEDINISRRESKVLFFSYAIKYLEERNLENYNSQTKSIMKNANEYLGDIELLNKNVDNALYYYNNAIRYGASKYDTYKLIGSVCDDNKDYFKAIEYYTKALNVKGNSELYLWRAEAKEHIRDYDGAIYDYTKAIGYNKSLREAYFGRANIYFIQRKYSIALNDYLKASNLDKTEPAALYNAGICLYNTGKIQAALPYLTRAKNLFQKQGLRDEYNTTINLINRINGYSRW